ncbi:protein C3orf33 homolog [Tachyglossus aculeatus]|uniref:protein C3orf33 homolog n=1 Tax=Tachyglossus aculeatus TaxID=9261 RepID=UPI0018F5AF7A|nr:protein C3orf33 homolog [Tachyglossus aculeatus]
MAVAGIILFARSIKLTSKFTHPSEIPVEFVQKNVKLRGQLRQVTEKGLEIEHVPIMMPLSSFRQKQSHDALLIKLAGVELTENGKIWLRKKLRPSEMVWFQLLGRENSTLICHLFLTKGMFFNVNLSEEILRRGLGKTTLVEGLHHESKLYWKLQKRLFQAELKALRKGEGLWRDESEKESYMEKIQKVKGFWKDTFIKDSFTERFKYRYQNFMQQMGNSTFVLKFKEFTSRLTLGRKKSDD